MKLLKNIKGIDIFGLNLELSIKKKLTHNTFCGAFTTLFIVFAAGYSFLILFLEMFTR